MLHLITGVPPEIAGLPTWVLNGLSIGSLVTFLLVGVATSRLWTKRQVDILREDHKQAQEDMKARYETHLTRTVELWQGRVEDAVRREEEWRGVAERWQEAATTLGDSVDSMQEQSVTILHIVQEMQQAQRSAPRKQGR